MRPVVARPDGELEVLGGFRPAARSGGKLVPLDANELIPIPEGTTLMHLPGRRALALDAKNRPVDIEADLLPVAAVLPVGFLRTLLPASRPLPGSRRLPLYGYAAVVEHHDELRVAALNTDGFGWWEPARYAGEALPEAIEAARAALPGNRLVDHLANLRHRVTVLHSAEHLPSALRRCAAGLTCLQRGLPGLHLLQTDGQAPAPQPRMRFAPTAAELAGMAGFHLGGHGRRHRLVRSGLRGRAAHARRRACGRRRLDPCSSIRTATIHVNTNGSRPRTSSSVSSTRAATACASARSRSAIPSFAPTTVRWGTRSRTSSSAGG